MLGEHDIELTRTEQNPDGSAKCEVREGRLSDSTYETTFSHESLYRNHGPITEMTIHWGEWEFFGFDIRYDEGDSLKVQNQRGSCNKK